MGKDVWPTSQRSPPSELSGLQGSVLEDQACQPRWSTRTWTQGRLLQSFGFCILIGRLKGQPLSKSSSTPPVSDAALRAFFLFGQYDDSFLSRAPSPDPKPTARSHKSRRHNKPADAGTVRKPPFLVPKPARAIQKPSVVVKRDIKQPTLNFPPPPPPPKYNPFTLRLRPIPRSPADEGYDPYAERAYYLFGEYDGSYMDENAPESEDDSDSEEVTEQPQAVNDVPLPPRSRTSDRPCRDISTRHGGVVNVYAERAYYLFGEYDDSYRLPKNPFSELKDEEKHDFVISKSRL